MINTNLDKTMESITIYPENEKQKSLLKSLLEEMKIRFELVNNNDDLSYSEKDFIAKIDESIKQAEQGKRKTISLAQQKSLLGL